MAKKFRYKNFEGLILSAIHSYIFARIENEKVGYWQIKELRIEGVEKKKEATELYGSASLICRNEEVRKIEYEIIVSAGLLDIGCWENGKNSGEGLFTVYDPRNPNSPTVILPTPIYRLPSS